MAETQNKVSWYVLQVMSGQENKVFESLNFICASDPENIIEQDSEKQRKYRGIFKGLVYGIHEINIPYELIEERKQGAKKASKDKKSEKSFKERKLYPGYVLVRMEIYDAEGKLIPDNWNFIRGTKGVIGLLGGQIPVPLTDAEAAEMVRINDEAEEEKSRPRVLYNVGESVVIKEGAFADCEGVIEAVDDERGRLKVLVSIFGRYTSVEAEFWQVERP